MAQQTFTLIADPIPGRHRFRISTDVDGLLWLQQHGFEVCSQQIVPPLGLSYEPCDPAVIRSQWLALTAISVGRAWSQERQQQAWDISVLRGADDVVATINPRWHYVDHCSDEIVWHLLIGLDCADRPLPVAALVLLQIVQTSDPARPAIVAPHVGRAERANQGA